MHTQKARPPSREKSHSSFVDSVPGKGRYIALFYKSRTHSELGTSPKGIDQNAAISGYVRPQLVRKVCSTIATVDERPPNGNPDVYRAFTSGLHVARRSDWFWAGLSIDLVIEQVFMRSLKTGGGLTTGRGLTEQQRLIWLLLMPAWPKQTTSCKSWREFSSTLENRTKICLGKTDKRYGGHCDHSSGHWLPTTLSLWTLTIS